MLDHETKAIYVNYYMLDHETKEPSVGKDLRGHLSSGITFQKSQQVAMQFGLASTIPTHWKSS